MKNFSGLDPFQLEAEDLDRQYQLALADSLRQAPEGRVVNGLLLAGGGIGRGLTDYMRRQEAERKLRVDLPAAKAALGHKSQQALIDALRQGTPEAFIGHPELRDMGMKELQADRKRTRSVQEMKDILGMLEGPSAPAAGPAAAGGDAAEGLMRKATAMALSPDPEISKRGTLLLKQLEGQNPQNSIRINPLTGKASPIAGALEAYKNNQMADEEARASYQIENVPIGGGRTMALPRVEAIRRLNGGSPQSPQSPQQGGVGAGVPPVSPAGVGAGSGAAAGPVPANAGGGVPPGSGMPEELRVWGGPEGLQNAFDNATKRGDMRTADYFGTLAAKYGIRLQSSNRMTEPQRRNMSVTATEREQIPSSVPPSQFGVSDPEASEFRKQAAASGREYLAKKQELKESNNTARDSLITMLRLNAEDKVIGGPFPQAKLVVRRAMGNLTGDMPEEISATELYNKLNLGQLKDQLKAFGSGTGISNLDLLTAAKMLPDAVNSKEGRDFILKHMIGLTNTVEANIQGVEAYFQKYRTLDGYKPVVLDWQGNLGKSKVTPDELEKGFRAAMGQGPVAPAKLMPDSEYEKFYGEPPSKTGPLATPFGVLKESGKRVWETVKRPGEYAEGMWDQWSNLPSTMGAIVGAVPGSSLRPERERQERRASESTAYDVGHRMGSVVDPTLLLGLGAIAKGGVAAAQAAKALGMTTEGVMRVAKTGLAGGAGGGAIGALIAYIMNRGG